MHIEVQVALNFVISYLYNKLPRRRVNIFGEELEKALKDKFQGHWYPEKPFKGSAFRCLKTGDPIDKVLERAARESGVPIQDILENLPQELAVWVDPGEVSYRIGEKGAVKILFSEKVDPQEDHFADREVTKTFNPEAQCFRPIDSVSCSLNNLSLSPSSSSSSSNKSIGQFNGGVIANGNNSVAHQLQSQISLHQQPNGNHHQVAPNNLHLVTGSNSSSAPSPTASTTMGNSFKGSPSPVPGAAFIPRTTTPLTFTTATFAQTKFGSTKLKTSSKRANRMSPTEFSNYIKQRAMQQQIMHQQQQQQPPSNHHHSPGSRALSPDPSSSSAYYFPSSHHHHGPSFPLQQQQQQFPPSRSMFDLHQSSNHQFLSPADLYPGSKNSVNFPFDNSPFSSFYPNNNNNNNNNNGLVNMPPNSSNNPGQNNNKDMLDNWAYTTAAAAAGRYQHLLVAN